jgi:hypothetical protein
LQHIAGEMRNEKIIDVLLEHEIPESSNLNGGD